jgi:hypothetical protein
MSKETTKIECGECGRSWYLNNGRVDNAEAARAALHHVATCNVKPEVEKNIQMLLEVLQELSGARVDEAILSLHALANDAAEATEHAMNAIALCNEYSDHLDGPAVSALITMAAMMRAARDLTERVNEMVEEYFQAPE